MTNNYTILKPFQPFSRLLEPLKVKLNTEEFYRFQKSMMVTLPLSHELCATAVEHATEFISFESMFAKIISNAAVEAQCSLILTELLKQLEPQFQQLEHRLGVTIATNNLADECAGAFHIQSNTAMLNLPKIASIVASYIAKQQPNINSSEFKATVAVNILQIVAHECAHAIWYRAEENLTAVEMFSIRSSIIRLYAGLKSAVVISHTGEDSEELHYVTGDPAVILQNYHQLTETLLAGEFLAEYFVSDLLTSLDYSGLPFSADLCDMLNSANETRDMLSKTYLTTEAREVFAQIEEVFAWVSTELPDYTLRPQFLKSVLPPKVPKINAVLADKTLLEFLNHGHRQEAEAKIKIAELEPYKTLFLWAPKGKKVQGIHLSYVGKFVILNLRNYALKHPDSILRHPNKESIFPLIFNSDDVLE